MINYQQHLENVISQQKSLIEELDSLNREVLIKKEQILKYQGIVEYLNAIINDSETSDNESKEVDSEKEKTES